jgi:cytochrome c556
MINFINAVKSTLLSFKLKSLYKAVLGLLAITLLVTTTACNGSEVAAKTNLDNPPSGKITQLYKPIAPEVGGMNNYSDVDPRVDTSKVDAKGKRLIEQAKDLERKDTNPLQQIQKGFDKKGIQERVGDTADSVRESAEETAEGISKGTRKGFANVKENAKSFKRDVESASEDLGDKVRDKSDDIQDNIRKAS